jgi:hypothetical protein
MSDYILRFFAGGIAVTAFAAIGDVLRPKSFAGLFAAAPSIALATLLLAIADKGSAYVALEARQGSGSFGCSGRGTGQPRSRSVCACRLDNGGRDWFLGAGMGHCSLDDYLDPCLAHSPMDLGKPPFRVL